MAIAAAALVRAQAPALEVDARAIQPGELIVVSVAAPPKA